MPCLQLVQAQLVDAHVFLTLEMDGNLDVYYERRKAVLEVSHTLCAMLVLIIRCVFAATGTYQTSAAASEQRRKIRGTLGRMSRGTLSLTRTGSVLAYRYLLQLV